MNKSPENKEKTAAPPARRFVQQADALVGALLGWYRANRRRLPFREAPTAYRVWVSEVMLQQTQVKTMLPYYERFVAKLPDVAALAACDDGTLHKLWEGLGYYTRARNLKLAAQRVVQRHGGALPASYDALLALPGVGAYTAGAIASIAFGLPYVAVDGNVLRVMARLLDWDADIGLPATRRAITAQVAALQPAGAPGDYNQALMELGALVCLPAVPRCGGCPLAALCAGHAAGRAAQLPVKAPARPRRRVAVCGLVVHSQSRVLLHRRGEAGLLAGLWEPVLFEGRLPRSEAQRRLQALVPGARITGPLPAAKHVFTHLEWGLYGWRCTAPPGAVAPGGDWLFADAQVLAGCALPTAFAPWRAAIYGGVGAAAQAGLGRDDVDE